MLEFDHFNIRAPSHRLIQVRDFYVAVFGWQVGFRPAMRRPNQTGAAVSSEGYWLYQSDRAVLHLSVAAVDEPCDATGYLDHLAFRVADIQGMKHKLQALAIPYTEKTLTDIAVVQLFFRDPAGLRLEINGTQASL